MSHPFLLPALFVLLAGLPLAACHAAPAAIKPPAAACDCRTAICLRFADVTAHPVTLQGQLITLATTGPNNQPYHPLALRLARPLCVAADPTAIGLPESRAAGPLSVVQLAPKSPTIPTQLNTQVGHIVAVSGKMFAAFSGWHVMPVLIDVDQLTLVR